LQLRRHVGVGLETLVRRQASTRVVSFGYIGHMIAIVVSLYVLFLLWVLVLHIFIEVGVVGGVFQRI
jgi:ABC-type multidrug transport system permease subunit